MLSDADKRPLRRRAIEICSGLPEVTQEGERHLGFSVKNKRFAWLLDDHHGDGRLALNCKAPPGESAALAERHPERFFVPSYLGARGWIGLWLDTDAVDWEEVERVVFEAWLLAAPKRLGASVRSRLPDSHGSPSP
jgi:hypothetical protein